MLSPEILAATLRVRGRRRSSSRPVVHPVGAERRLAEVVDHDRQPGERRGKLGHVAEMAREDARQLEDQLPLLEQREALEHVVAEDPVRIGLVVDEVADAAQLRPAQRARRGARASRSAESRSTQAITAPIHGVRGCVLEHRVGVGVGAGGLDEHGRRRPRRGRAAARGRPARTSRRIASCSSVIHGWASRSRFQKCWCASTITRSWLRF